MFGSLLLTFSLCAALSFLPWSLFGGGVRLGGIFGLELATWLVDSLNVAGAVARDIDRGDRFHLPGLHVHPLEARRVVRRSDRVVRAPGRRRSANGAPGCGSAPSKRPWSARPSRCASRARRRSEKVAVTPAPGPLAGDTPPWAEYCRSPSEPEPAYRVRQHRRDPHLPARRSRACAGACVRAGPWPAGPGPRPPTRRPPCCSSFLPPSCSTKCPAATRTTSRS